MKFIFKIIITIVFMTYGFATAQIGVGTVTPDASAILEMKSSNKGILLPRLSGINRGSILLPAKGLLIFNLDNNSVEVNSGTPSAPNWISVTGATGSQGLTSVALGPFNVASGINASGVGGTYNTATGLNSSTTGGTYNIATGINASTIGGSLNQATGINSSALGGTENLADDLNSTTIGGTLNVASGINSSVIGGSTNTASGINASVVGGTTNLAYAINSTVMGGNTNQANGIDSGVVAGSNNKANNLSSLVAGGNNNKANGINSSVVGGATNEAFGLNSNVSGGTTNTAFGINSGVLAGTTNYAFGINSTIVGGSTNRADGDNSNVTCGAFNIAIAAFSSVSGGFGNNARSYGEWVGGLNGTDYVAASLTAFAAPDRIFNIGNGVSSASKSDALTILKNGLATLPSVTNALIDGDLTGKAITTKEFTDANYTKFNNVAPASATATGKIGEVRMTATHIYFCYGVNLWIRAAVSTWN